MSIRIFFFLVLYGFLLIPFSCKDECEGYEEAHLTVTEVYIDEFESSGTQWVFLVKMDWTESSLSSYFSFPVHSIQAHGEEPESAIERMESIDIILMADLKTRDQLFEEGDTISHLFHLSASGIQFSLEDLTEVPLFEEMMSDGMPVLFDEELAEPFSGQLLIIITLDTKDSFEIVSQEYKAVQ